MPFGLLVESAVAILLAVTIGYCLLLNHRLKRLQADRAVLSQMISDLLKATDLANAAIRGLKETAIETEGAIAARLDQAERFGVELANHVSAGQSVLERIARIMAVTSGKTPPAETFEPVATGKAQAALQQLALNPRMRGNAA